MSERTWTEEEIRAAMGPILNCSNNEERIIAELNKPTPPPIHPDVPVLYDYAGEPIVLPGVSFNELMVNHPNEIRTNVRPLIPTEAFEKWALEWRDTSTPLGLFIDRKVAHYKKTGEV